MPTVVQCPNPDCGKSYSIADEQLGRKGRCRHCGKTFQLGSPTLRESQVAFNSPSDRGGSGTTRRSVPPAADAAGERGTARSLDRFEIRERLGAGAFGAVYRAFDPQLERDVALKVPQAATLESPRAVERFLREAKAAAQLRHPHIVPVYDAGRDGESYYIASAFIEGQTLEAAIEQREEQGVHFEFREAAEVVRKLAEAVDYAHGLGIVHRDIKPANVMLDARGGPHLMDFGLARFEASQEKLTHDGAVLGTPAYMSPEQAKGDQTEVGPGSDQYSLAVMLYELLTGQTPFSGPPAVVIFNVLNQPIPPPRSCNPRIPRDLETICLKALSREPSDRYACCADLAADLQRWLTDQPIRARRTGIAERAWRWGRRNPILAGMTGTAAALLVAVAAVSTFAAVRLDREKRRADRSAAEARQQSEAAQEESRRAYRHYYGAQINLMQRDWDTRDTGSLRERLERTRPEETGGMDLRGFEWHYWNRRGRDDEEFQDMLTLDGHADTVTCVAFSVDGGRMVSGSADAMLKVWDTRTAQAILTLRGHAHPVASVAFSPDGRRIVSGSEDHTLKVWDAGTGQPLATLQGHTEVVHSVAFSPDGESIASASRDRTVKIWDGATGRETRTLRHPWPVSSVAFGAEGRRIVSGSGQITAGLVHVWDVASGQELLKWPAHTFGVNSVAFSPDGQRIVSGGNRVGVGQIGSGVDSTLKVWDAGTGEALLTLHGHTSDVSSVAFSPDGRRIVSGSGAVASRYDQDYERTVKIWDAETGQELVTLWRYAGDEAGQESSSRRGLTRRVTSVAFSTDGQGIAAGRGNTVMVWGVPSGWESRTFRGHTDKVLSVAFSPDARRIVSVSGVGRSRGGTVKVWDVETGQELLAFPAHDPSASGFLLNSAAFSPDGRRIVTGGNRADSGGASVWDAETGERLLSLPGSPRAVAALFSPDGGRIAGAVGNSVMVWDARTGQELLTFQGHANNVKSVAFSPDGRRIVSGSLKRGSNQPLIVWDARTGQPLLTLEGHTDDVHSAAFSPDGQRIVSGSGSIARNGTIKVWDAQSGRELLTLGGHSNRVTSVAFSHDGGWITSGSLDKTVRLWDVRSGQEAFALRGHTGYVHSVAISRDGRRIVSGSEDKTVKVWESP